MMLVAFVAPTGWALVCHEADWPLPAELPDTLPAECLAMIDNGYTKISAAVIAPNFIITANHWGNHVCKKLRLGNEDGCNYILVQMRGDAFSDIAVYRVKKLEWQDPEHPGDPTNAQREDYDHLKDADFRQWAELYTGDDEVGKITIIGSYGPQRISIGNEVITQDDYPPIIIDPGQLHWGQNVVSSAISTRLYMTFTPIGRDDYIRYEVYGGRWDSASPWFIKDGASWKLASFYSGPCVGPRLGCSAYANWVYDKIWLMSDLEPAPGAAKNPSPAVDSQAIDYPVLMLTWKPGAGAVRHDVYLGDRSALIEAADRQSQDLFKGTLTEPVFEPSDLEPRRKYYWRVDEIDSNGHITKGLVWWFIYTPHRVRNIHAGRWYCFIQEAIDEADAGDEIEARQGSYNEILRFYNANGYKAVKVRSTDPTDWDVVEETRILGGAVFPSGGGTIDAELKGFSIISKKSRGILICNSSPIITRCIVEGDPIEDREDFLIHVWGDSTPVIANNIVRGGFIGLYFDGLTSSGIVRNNTILHNDYGIAVGDDVTSPLIKNCIVWANGSDPSCNLVGVFDRVEYCCIGGLGCEPGQRDAKGNFDLVPQFVDEDNGDLHLRVNSPCINAGDPDTVPWLGDIDIDGEPRVMGGAVDVGADEVSLMVDTSAERFSSSKVFDLSYKALMFVPAADATSYGACLREITQLPTNPVGSTILSLGDDGCEMVSLSDGKTVLIYGRPFQTFYIGSNGYITFSESDNDHGESLFDHFRTERISCLFNDFDPSAGGTVSWRQMADRVVVTWQDVPEYGQSNSNTFQVEMYFDGRIQLAWLGVPAEEGIVGLSDGLGLPVGFKEADFSEHPRCRVGPPTISGYVRTTDGSGMSGVALTFSNDGGNTITDSRGYYHKTVPHLWSGQVTLSANGYIFSPLPRSYTRVTLDRSDQDYTGSVEQLPGYFAEQFSWDNSFDLSYRSIMFTPTGDEAFYSVCLQEITRLPTSPAGGIYVSLNDDSYASVSLNGQETISIYGRRFRSFYVGSNGYITFSKGDDTPSESLSRHFQTERISCLFTDLDPSINGVVSWRRLADRVAVTWEYVSEHNQSNSNTFQVEMYFDGRIQLAWLGIAATEGIVGLSNGLGLPLDFRQTDLSEYPPCATKKPIISGYVWALGNAGIGGVTLSFSNDGGSATTDSSGCYNKTVSYGWSGVATPTKSGYAMSPPCRSYTNVTSDISDQNYVALVDRLPDYFAERFDSDVDAFDLSNRSIMFVPTGDGDSYGACLKEITQLPTSPAWGTTLMLNDDGCELVSLDGQKMVSLCGVSFPAFYVCSNGYITFSQGDVDHGESLPDHFRTERISCLFKDLDPSMGGLVSWKQASDRVVVTWQEVPEFGESNSNTFQVEMYFDGRIQLAWLAVAAKEGIVGLSNGLGLPADFQETDLSAYTPCGTGPPVISGSIRTFAGAGISGVTLTFSNDSGVSTTDSAGNYSKTVAYGWSGQVTPTKSGYTLSPPLRAYSGVASDIADQDYVGFMLMGDFDADNDVDLADFALFARRWRRTDSSFRYGGGGADFTDDEYVDFNDFKKLADNWLASIQ